MELLRVDLDVAAKFAQIGVGLVAAIVAAAGVWHYIHTDQHRMADTFIKLEERFRELQPIARLIDPAAKESDELVAALAGSIAGRQKTGAERDLVVKYDELMRFFLLLGRLHKSTFLRQGELISMYAYWFAAIRGHSVMWSYTSRYFRALQSFIGEVKIPSFEQQW